MNSVSLVGRLVRDPEVRYTPSQMAVARFTVAVDRPFSRDSEQTADFISCVAFGKQAEFIERYFTKGRPIGLTGRIQTGSYTNKDGVKVYTTDVVADRVEFVGNKEGNGGSAAPAKSGGDFDMGIPEGFSALEDEDLPF
ncbi:MAG: single-stranded DNA-binding protein [Firmicutes bacterium]|nr:single-stranded DNA-binding protein [Clostridiales bacterium]MBQ2747674.1 single-stranded DNA-binding protein [Bacillota bacterium]MBQ3123614.1 single-stranded DNA-binding protein [Bacillota bacterium]MBQ9972793.1 single-stranded DNA-binding protein [Bacillota bacterium]